MEILGNDCGPFFGNAGDPEHVGLSIASTLNQQGLATWHSAAIWFGQSNDVSHTNTDAAEYCGVRRAFSDASGVCVRLGGGAQTTGA